MKIHVLIFMAIVFVLWLHHEFKSGAVNERIAEIKETTEVEKSKRGLNKTLALEDSELKIGLLKVGQDYKVAKKILIGLCDNFDAFRPKDTVTNCIKKTFLGFKVTEIELSESEDWFSKTLLEVRVGLDGANMSALANKFSSIYQLDSEPTCEVINKTKTDSKVLTIPIVDIKTVPLNKSGGSDFVLCEMSFDNGKIQVTEYPNKYTVVSFK